VSTCEDGLTSCDRSKLTTAEARDLSSTERLRNVANCQNGMGAVTTRS